MRDGVNGNGIFRESDRIDSKVVVVVTGLRRTLASITSWSCSGLGLCFSTRPSMVGAGGGGSRAVPCSRSRSSPSDSFRVPHPAPHRHRTASSRYYAPRPGPGLTQQHNHIDKAGHRGTWQEPCGVEPHRRIAFSRTEPSRLLAEARRDIGHTTRSQG